MIEVITVIATALGAFLSLIEVSVRVGRRKDEVLAKEVSAMVKARWTPESPEDLRATHDYLFEKVGMLSLDGYSNSPEARDAVASAIKRAERIVARSSEEEVGLQESQPDTGEGYVAALAQGRLAFETVLREQAESLGIPVDRKPVSQIVAALLRQGEIGGLEAKGAISGYRIASRALHGEELSRDEVVQALDQLASARRALLRMENAS